MYLLGMTLSACRQIESAKDVLFALFAEAESWGDWNHGQKANLLLRLSAFVFTVRDTSPDASVPEEWPAILTLWLSGMGSSDMVREESVASLTRSPSELSLLIEDLCGYRLPWGLNSILVHLKSLESEMGKTLPPVCSFFSGMVKYGLSDPVAVCLLPYLDQERTLALTLAPICPHGFERPDEVARWILSVTPEWLAEAGLEPGVVTQVLNARSWHRSAERSERSRRNAHLKILAAAEVPDTLEAGHKVLVVADATLPGTFDVRTLQGAVVSRFTHQTAETPWWADPHIVDAEVTWAHDDGSENRILALNMVES
jgi:hypothetical protein